MLSHSASCQTKTAISKLKLNPLQYNKLIIYMYGREYTYVYNLRFPVFFFFQ